MSKKLSIIVPVYNGAAFIEACLSSLIHQLSESVELIVVNDGSTDATDQVIREKFQYFIDQGHLIYLPTPNAGVSAARNLGLDHAKGDYVAFVDADDLVSTHYVTTLVDAMANSPSIIEFGYRSIAQDGEILIDRCFVHTKFGNHPAAAIEDTVFSACLWYPWLRVCKRHLFTTIRFPVGVRYCEDVMALSAVYKEASTVCTLPSVLYDYRVNPAGATMNINPDHAGHLVDFYRTLRPANRFIDKALKLNLAYAIRRCTAAVPNSFGVMPADLEADIRTLVWTPRLLFKIRLRLVLHALWGPGLSRAKRWLRSAARSRRPFATVKKSKL